MAYATFEEYRTIYAGTLFTAENQMLPFAERASDYMDAVTFDRIAQNPPQDGDTQRKIKKCCCALAENLYYYDAKLHPDAAASGGIKQSETSSKYSVTYANPLDSLSTLTGSTFQDYQYHTALQYLGRTGLMYRGVDE
ncbi:MAG: hypothetical protein ACI4JQ_02165 [Ruminococcus sp.]